MKKEKNRQVSEISKTMVLRCQPKKEKKRREIR
jgi:hypothetical protein